jgi:hypothetical protein
VIQALKALRLASDVKPRRDLIKKEARQAA